MLSQADRPEEALPFAEMATDAGARGAGRAAGRTRRAAGPDPRSGGGRACCRQQPWRNPPSAAGDRRARRPASPPTSRSGRRQRAGPARTRWPGGPSAPCARPAISTPAWPSSACCRRRWRRRPPGSRPAASTRPGRIDKAVEAPQTFIREYPASEYTPEAMHRLGAALQAQGRIDEAIGVYENLLREVRAHPGGLRVAGSARPLPHRAGAGALRHGREGPAVDRRGRPGPSAAVHPVGPGVPRRPDGTGQPLHALGQARAGDRAAGAGPLALCRGSRDHADAVPAGRRLPPQRPGAAGRRRAR